MVENKADLLDEDKRGKTQDLEHFAETNGFCGSIRTSAKTGMNINESLDYLIDEIIQRMEAIQTSGEEVFTNERKNVPVDPEIDNEISKKVKNKDNKSKNNYKKEDNTLEKKLNEEILKNKRLEEENKKLKDNLNTITNENKNLKLELEKLKLENNKLKSELLKSNKIISNIQNIQIGNKEFKKLKDENAVLKYQLNIKDNEIQELKLKIPNNKIIDRPKYDINDMMVINFISQDSSVQEGVICLPTDVFAEVEEKLYKKYDNLRNTNNMFTANAKPVLRFKKICENGIKNGDKIQLFKLE